MEVAVVVERLGESDFADEVPSGAEYSKRFGCAEIGLLDVLEYTGREHDIKGRVVKGQGACAARTGASGSAC